MKALGWMFVASLVLVTGCSATKPTLERGWIGATYEDLNPGFSLLRGMAAWAFSKPLVLPGEHADGVLVTQVFAGTPAAEAGLEPGDVIVAVDGAPVTEREALEELVDASLPGTPLALEVYRIGEVLPCTVTTGCERYERVGTLSIGLGFSSAIDPFPNPNFNLLGIVFFHRSDSRLELHAPRPRVRASLARRAVDEVEAPLAMTSGEGWKTHLGIIGFGRHTRVLAQEPYSAR